jgi:hypothetical protein
MDRYSYFHFATSEFSCNCILEHFVELAREKILLCQLYYTKIPSAVICGRPFKSLVPEYQEQ